MTVESMPQFICRHKHWWRLHGALSTSFKFCPSCWPDRLAVLPAAGDRRCETETSRVSGEQSTAGWRCSERKGHSGFCVFGTSWISPVLVAFLAQAEALIAERLAVREAQADGWKAHAAEMQQAQPNRGLAVVGESTGKAQGSGEIFLVDTTTNRFQSAVAANRAVHVADRAIGDLFAESAPEVASPDSDYVDVLAWACRWARLKQDRAEAVLAPGEKEFISDGSALPSAALGAWYEARGDACNADEALIKYLVRNHFAGRNLPVPEIHR